MWVVLSLTFTFIKSVLNVFVTTDLPAHLYAIWTFTSPTRTQRWKYNRGVPAPCGWNYTYLNTTCVEQWEVGPTELHSFGLGLIPPGSTIYLFLAESCTSAPGVSTSPPMTIIVPPDPEGLCLLQMSTGGPPLPPPIPPMAIVTTISVS